jgi:hypothetical protein
MPRAKRKRGCLSAPPKSLEVEAAFGNGRPQRDYSFWRSGCRVRQLLAAPKQAVEVP